MPTEGAGGGAAEKALRPSLQGGLFRARSGRGEGSVELELRRLDRKYAGLRVLASNRLGQMVASLAEVGQQSPVMVVLTSSTTAVLIDGYIRAAGLDKLGRDTVQTVAVDLPEADALLLRHQLAAQQQRSALQEGWLLRELHDGHHLNQRQLAVRLDRSPSWVSRRLGMVRDMPENVQALVRHGWVSPHSASKELLALARANPQACEALSQRLGGARWSTREIAEIHHGWRQANAQTRQRIEQDPALYCRARAELMAPTAVMCERDAKLARDLHKLRALCVHLQGHLGPRLRLQERLDTAQALVAQWHACEQAFAALQVVAQEALSHAQ